MSHIAKQEIELNDRKCLEATCKRLGIKTEEVTNYKFYDGNKASGLAIYFKGWRYPAVLTNNGELIYDNYNGHWGDIQEVNTLKQYYGVERAKKAARIKGYSVTETTDKLGRPQVKILV